MDVTAFLKTGNYNNIRVGMPLKELYSSLDENSLGSKWYYNNNDISEGYSYFYRALELMIINDELYSLRVNLNTSENIILHDYLINEQTSFETLLKLLDVAGISWNVDAKYCYDREIGVVTEGNVLLGCIFARGGYWLSSFQVF